MNGHPHSNMGQNPAYRPSDPLILKLTFLLVWDLELLAGIGYKTRIKVL